MPRVEFLGGPRDGGWIPVWAKREYVRVASMAESFVLCPDGRPDFAKKTFPHLYCLCQNTNTGDYAYVYEPDVPDEGWLI